MIHIKFSLFCSTTYSNTDRLHSCFIFGLSALDLKLRVKVTLHKTDVREHTSLDGCNCAVLFAHNTNASFSLKKTITGRLIRSRTLKYTSITKQRTHGCCVSVSAVGKFASYAISTAES